MLYQVICCDPPWSFSDELQKMKSSTKRSAASQYQTMLLSDIQSLDVQSLADPNGCVLALWVPSSLLVNGIATLSAWGFSLKQTYVWVKTKKDPLRDLRNSAVELGKIDGELGVEQYEACMDKFEPASMLAFGMGRLFRQTHEIALIGTLGYTVYADLNDHSQRSVCFATNAGHSCKPEMLQDSLDIMFPNAAKLEMFARRNRQGWTCIGDGVTSEDIRDSIVKLQNQ